MDSPDSEWLLGVDGGGSKTVAWLSQYSRGDNSLSDPVEGIAGASNPRVAGLEPAMQQVHLATKRAFAVAGRPMSPVSSACLAIAGADRDDARAGIEAWARQHHLSAVLTVCNDAEPLLACLPERCGIALIAGTGAFAYGRDAAGQVARAGGWGYRFGDEGSGYALAVAGVAAALRYADGRERFTQLLEAILAHFHVQNPRDLIEHLYAPEFDRRAVAQLAPLVLDLADQGDEVASGIRQRAASELCQLVLAVQRALQLPGPVLHIALSGSVLIQGESLRHALLDDLLSAGFEPEVTGVPMPVAGTLLIAHAALSSHHAPP